MLVGDSEEGAGNPSGACLGPSNTINIGFNINDFLKTLKFGTTTSISSNGPQNVAKFMEFPEGELWSLFFDHNTPSKKCSFCGAKRIGVSKTTINFGPFFSNFQNFDFWWSLWGWSRNLVFYM